MESLRFIHPLDISCFPACLSWVPTFPRCFGALAVAVCALIILRPLQFFSLLSSFSTRQEVFFFDMPFFQQRLSRASSQDRTCTGRRMTAKIDTLSPNSTWKTSAVGVKARGQAALFFIPFIKTVRFSVIHMPVPPVGCFVSPCMRCRGQRSQDRKDQVVLQSPILASSPLPPLLQAP